MTGRVHEVWSFWKDLVDEILPSAARSDKPSFNLSYALKYTAQFGNKARSVGVSPR
jgi:hypothetical protein